MPLAIKILFAFAYDLLLLCAIWVAGAFPFVIWQGEDFQRNPYALVGFQAYLIGLTYLYLTYFWTQNGQTPGLRVWRLALVRNDHYLMPRYQANLRFLAGILLFWIGWIGLFTPMKRTLQDHLSGTRILPLSAINPEN
jgi:uncharacterized RDD family membrane protein YckC